MMDIKGGCCTAPYSGGLCDMSKVDRIMLRFRPIAPKPTSGSSVSGGSGTENSDTYATAGRRKRRYSKSDNSVSKKFSRSGKRKGSREATGSYGKTPYVRSLSVVETKVTLPLLPETPDRRNLPSRGSSSENSDCGRTQKNLPIWLRFDSHHPVIDGQMPYGVGHVGRLPVDRALARPVSLVGSYVTVECITDTWLDGFGLGCTDEERMMTLDRDTCPGFISDCFNRVKWANKAYKELLGQVSRDGGVTVLLLMKGGVVLPALCPAFTCKVKVTCGKERNSLLTLPCDVWRMDGGGFAWRLDVKAALSLGR